MICMITEPPIARLAFLQRVANLGSDFFDAPTVRLDDQVCDLAIQRIPDLHKLLQHAFIVAVVEQRPIATALGAIQLLLDAGMKVDDVTSRAQPAAAVGVQHRTTTGSEHYPLTLRELIDDFYLAFAKALLTFLLEDKGNIDPGSILYFLVAVDEVEVQESGQLTADGGLARTHRADQNHIARQ